MPPKQDKQKPAPAASGKPATPPTGAAGGNATSPSTTPRTQQQQQGGNKQGPVSVADVKVDGVPTIDITLLPVPHLTEDHALTMQEACTDEDLDAKLVRAERFAPDDGSKRKNADKERQGLSDADYLSGDRDTLLATLMAYHKKIHGNALRVHEELSRNLNVNLGDIVYLEHHLVQDLQRRGRDIPSYLPSFSVLVLHLFTMDVKDVEHFFAMQHANEEKENALGFDTGRSGGGGRANSERLSSVQSPQKKEKKDEQLDRLTHIRLMLAQRMFNKADGSCLADRVQAARRGPSWMFDEICQAMHQRNKRMLAKWAGTIMVLLASLHALANDEKRHAAQEKKYPQQKVATAAAITGKTKAEREAAKTAAAAVTMQGPPEHRAMLRYKLRYPSKTDAMQTLMGVAGISPEQETDVPIFQPLRDATGISLMNPALARPEDYVEQQPTLEQGAPGAHEEQVQVRCDGWVLEPELAQQRQLLEEQIAAAAAAATGVADATGLPSTTPQKDDKGKGAKDAKSEKEAGGKSANKGGKDGGKGNKDLQQQQGNAVGTSGLPSDLSGAIASLKQPVGYVTVSVSVWPRDIIDLTPFSYYPSEHERIIAPLSTVSVSGFTPERLEVALKQHSPQHKAVVTQLCGLFASVLEDVFKADEVATSLRTRLVSQFVKPHHCHSHVLEPYSSFCRTCKMFVCRACVRQVHTGHDLTQIAAFCVDEAVRLEPKRHITVRRLEVLRKLYDGIAMEEARLVHVVNGGIDDVMARLHERKEWLHEDARRRAAQQRRELEREMESCNADEAKLSEACRIVSGNKLGKVAPVPKVTVRKHWQVKDNLRLALPTEQLKKLVGLLTWSNPSKYLVSKIYPPEEETV